MNEFDIVLINVIIFMTGFGSGLGFCFKYRNRLISRSRSQEFRNNPMNQPPTQEQGQSQSQIQATAPQVPIYPTAPVPTAMGYPQESKKEIVIRTTE